MEKQLFKDQSWNFLKKKTNKNIGTYFEYCLPNQNDL